MKTTDRSADTLLSAQVVTAEVQLVTANATEHADLFWGLRGGGGNFGVVVSLEYRLHPLTTVLDARWHAGPVSLTRLLWSSRSRRAGACTTACHRLASD